MKVPRTSWEMKSVELIGGLLLLACKEMVLLTQKEDAGKGHICGEQTKSSVGRTYSRVA